MCRRGGFSDGRTPYCLDRRRVFSVRRARPRPIPRAARRGSRKGAESAAQASRARLQARSRSKRGLLRKRRSKGAGRRRLFCGRCICQKQKRRRSKADYAPARRFFRRAHATLSRLAARFFRCGVHAPAHLPRRKARQPQKVGSDSEPL